MTRTAAAAAALTVGLAAVAVGCGSTGRAAERASPPAPKGAVPVLVYHQLGEPGPYSVSLDAFRAQLDELRREGYTTITLAQYQAWLAGARLPVTRPLLITFDDGFTSQANADPLLAARGFSAVLFVVTGFASGSDRYWLSWPGLRRLAATGRWELAFHAGAHGHGPLRGSCRAFYVCERPRETFANYRRRVRNEVAAGTAELSREAPGWSRVAWAAPYDAAGQFGRDSNDARIPGWASRFFAERFPVVFVEDRTRGMHRRYRYEVKKATTLAQLRAALADRAFRR